MYQIQRLDLESLSPSDHQTYASFLDPSLHPFLNDPKGTIAIGATLYEKPVGIILIRQTIILHIAEVICFFIDPQHRHQGLALRLFSALEQELPKDGTQLVLFAYPTGTPNTLAIEQLLKKAQWTEPKVIHIHCRFDGPIFNPPWLNRQEQLPEGFQIFPWSDLQPFERERLIHQEKHNLIPREVSPFREEEKIELLNSFGLRHMGDIIGWMITHRLNDDTIGYTSLYILRKWQYSGIAIELLRTAILSQKQSTVRWAELDVNLSLTERSWLKFVERRLMPYAQEITYTKQSWKLLKNLGI